ncbi:MAG TPA: aminoacyl-tRNA hydrolase [Thiotrichaceae bacterium]|jgi:PTH1 family peptidyl-tRNA hydrolase|nr:aminoacyl-tRNA hydrolase [Thiotrichaceae bacterium]HIM09044.1 aminoacyl-tRNA hydrolase [Gammaproteobacteria bacterium]
MSLPVKMIVGLGNPGPEYLMTRHNAGFWFVDALANKLSLSFSQDKRSQSELCRYQSGSIDCWICKPQTYMNDSGAAVQALSSYYKIPVDQIMVVHDEIDLLPGTTRLKEGGGHGGHNGLRDIIQRMGSKDFLRLRVGVGHPGSKDKVVPFVLGRASSKEEDLIIDSFSLALEKSDQFFEDNLNKLMTELNNKNNSSS